MAKPEDEAEQRDLAQELLPQLEPDPIARGPFAEAATTADAELVDRLLQLHARPVQVGMLRAPLERAGPRHPRRLGPRA